MSNTACFGGLRETTVYWDCSIIARDHSSLVGCTLFEIQVQRADIRVAGLVREHPVRLLAQDAAARDGFRQIHGVRKDKGVIDRQAVRMEIQPAADMLPVTRVEPAAGTDGGSGAMGARAAFP